jgi:hypothetical protein
MYSELHDFARSCREADPCRATSSAPAPARFDIASLAPNVEVSVFPWREPPELLAPTNQPDAHLPQDASTDESRRPVRRGAYDSPWGGSPGRDRGIPPTQCEPPWRKALALIHLRLLRLLQAHQSVRGAEQ